MRAAWLAVAVMVSGCSSLWTPRQTAFEGRSEPWAGRLPYRAGQVVQVHQQGVYVFARCFDDCPAPTPKTLAVSAGATSLSVPEPQQPASSVQQDQVFSVAVSGDAWDEAKGVATMDDLAKQLPKSGGALTFMRQYAPTAEYVKRERALLMALARHNIGLVVTYSQHQSTVGVNLILV